MNILVLNCGSSSIKFQLIATDLEAIEHGADGSLRLFVIPTNEELLIARDAVRVILDAPRRW